MLKYKRFLLKLSGEALAGDKEFGFSDESHINKFFKIHHGISLKKFRMVHSNRE